VTQFPFGQLLAPMASSNDSESDGGHKDIRGSYGDTEGCFQNLRIPD
jgi:hypothetical protein